LKSASLQYANALADVALAQGTADAALKQLRDFAAAFGESSELRNFLTSPGVTREAKRGVIEKIAARTGAGKIIRNFLFVIADHRRTHILPEILATFEEVVRQRQGIAEAEISSAIELSAAQKKKFAQTLEKLTGTKVQAKYSLDPALLGGAVVRVGDTVYDGSVRNSLNEMRARLVAE
jgi:F-type H+-transporting ATPase subunit delta